MPILTYEDAHQELRAIEDKREALICFLTGKTSYKHMPMQPIVQDEHGVVRFKENKIVRDLVDSGKLDLNATAHYPFEDRSQLSQLIGYSVSGWGGLSTVSIDELALSEVLQKRLTEQLPIRADMTLVPRGLLSCLAQTRYHNGHWVVRRTAEKDLEVEWIDRSFCGMCSYDLSENEQLPSESDITVTVYIHGNKVTWGLIGDENNDDIKGGVNLLVDINWFDVTDKEGTYVFTLDKIIDLIGNDLAKDIKDLSNHLVRIGNALLIEKDLPKDLKLRTLGNCVANITDGELCLEYNQVSTAMNVEYLLAFLRRYPVP